MKYALLDNTNTVIQTEPRPRDGLIPAPPSVIPGYTYDPATRTFQPPPPFISDSSWIEKTENHISAFFSPYQLAVLLTVRDSNTKAADILSWLAQIVSKTGAELSPPPHTFTDIFS